MHLVGFIIEIYYVARPYERQILRIRILFQDLDTKGVNCE